LIYPFESAKKLFFIENKRFYVTQPIGCTMEPIGFILQTSVCIVNTVGFSS
jgi:hypothetical protein